MHTPQENLAIKAASLSKSSHREWQEFLDALAAYNEVHRENLVKSPLPELPVNQGRAQALSSLLDQLHKCRTIADKIAGKAPVR